LVAPVPFLERLERHPPHRKTRDRSSMASKAFRLILDKAIPEVPARSARKRPGIAGSDPENGGFESPLGCAEGAWGASEARNRDFRTDRFRWMPKRRKPASQSWRTLLDKHVGELVWIDFLTVPTAWAVPQFRVQTFSTRSRHIPSADLGPAASRRSSPNYGRAMRERQTCWPGFWRTTG
jgi:hypothetical protein